MEVVVGLLMLLLGVSHGVETFCDGRQDGAQCYAALGGTLVLRLMTSASNIVAYRWFKNETDAILRGKKDSAVTWLQNRSSFTPSNGTIRISDISWTDDAEYKLQVFDSGGKETEKRRLNLSIQIPVSSPLLASECLSQGEMRVSCSSEEGDSPQYSWTLDGHTLMDSQLLSADNETNNITLKQGVSGQLVCSVKNHVSSASASERISPCEGLVFIDCTLSNGTHIKQWVLETNKPLCVTTTTATTITDNVDSTMGKETIVSISSTHIIPSNQTVALSNTDGPWYLRNIPYIAGSLAAVLIVFLVVVGVYRTQLKKKNKTNQDREDDEDVTYANVRIAQRPGRQREERENVEVEYGEVKVSGERRPNGQPTADECVYAKVCVRR